MIDVIFTTAADVEQSSQPNEPEPPALEATVPAEATRAKGVWEFTDRTLMQAKRDAIIQALAKMTGSTLIQKSASLYWDATHSTRVACTISKRYARGTYHYWYAHHPAWDEFLAEAQRGFLVLGCMDMDSAFAIPSLEIRRVLDSLNVTQKDDGGVYWHMHLTERPDGVALMLPRQSSFLNLEPHRIPLTA